MSAKKYQHNKVWLNGKVVDPEDANVSIFTQTAMRGANVYEGIRAYWSDHDKNLYVWKVDQHIDRLFESMKIMSMTSPYTKQEYKTGIVEWAKSNEFKRDIHFRLVVYFGDGGGEGTKAYRAEEIDYGAWIAGGGRRNDAVLENGVRMAISTWRRISDDTMPPRVKAGANYQNSRLAGVEARKHGYDDALLLTKEGKLAESTGAGVMIVRKGKLITPPVTAGILESITREMLLDMWKKSSNEAPIERDVDRTELYVADEIFLCGTGKEVTPVVSVDGQQVGDGKRGPITKRLQDMLFEAARGANPDYLHQRTPVY